MSSKSFKQTLAECKKQNRPKRLAAQRAKVYLNDNLDWNEERALQKALEASLVEEAVRVQQDNDSNDSNCWQQNCKMSPLPTAQLQHTSSLFQTRTKNSFHPNDQDKILKTYKTINHLGNFLKNPNKTENDSDSECNRESFFNEKILINPSSTYDQNKLNNQHSSSIASPKYLDNASIRRTIAAQRKFPINSVLYQLSNQTFNDENDDDDDDDGEKNANEDEESNNNGDDDYDVDEDDNVDDGDDNDDDVDEYDDEGDDGDGDGDDDDDDDDDDDGGGGGDDKNENNNDNEEEEEEEDEEEKEEDKQNDNNGKWNCLYNCMNDEGEGENDDFNEDDELMSSDYINSFQLFPNTLINCSEFITWIRHTEFDEIKNVKADIKFATTYRSKEIFPYDHAMRMYRKHGMDEHEKNNIELDLIPSNIEEYYDFSSSNDDGDGSVEDEENDPNEEDYEEYNNNNNNNNNIIINNDKCDKQEQAAVKTIPKSDNASSTITRPMTRSARSSQANNADEYTKRTNNHFIHSDSEDDHEPEGIDEPKMEPRITRSNKCKQNSQLAQTCDKNTVSKLGQFSSGKWCSNAEETRKRALQYEANVRVSMKDIEKKYNSKRHDHCNNKILEYGTISSSLDDSDLDDDEDNNDDERVAKPTCQDNSNGQTNALRTVHSLRRIKTLRKEVLSKTNKTKNGINNNNNSNNNNRRNFDIRTRASMRRTRNSKLQHESRNRNNFLFRQYDGRTFASSTSCSSDPTHHAK